jgi:hypothetical protein
VPLFGDRRDRIRTGNLARYDDAVSQSRRTPTLWAALVTIPVALVVACAAQPQGVESNLSASAIGAGDNQAWVVVSFDDRQEEFDASLMDMLLETELQADEALAAADSGHIDGNDVGAYSYTLYFVGDDDEAMWAILEPVFAAAPVAWSEVELRDSFEDPTPEVFKQPR